MGITLDQQLAEIRRELGMRRHVFPRFVAANRLTQAQADERIAILEAVRETLERLRDKMRGEVSAPRE